jgi:hypothetical protein
MIVRWWRLSAVQPHVSNETVGSGIELVQPEEAIAVRIVFVALWVNAFTSYPDGIVRFSNLLRMRGWEPGLCANPVATVFAQRRIRATFDAIGARPSHLRNLVVRQSLAGNRTRGGRAKRKTRDTKDGRLSRCTTIHELMQTGTLRLIIRLSPEDALRRGLLALRSHRLGAPMRLDFSRIASLCKNQAV